MTKPNKRINELEEASNADIAGGVKLPVLVPNGGEGETKSMDYPSQMILKSPNGTLWRITIDNAGTLIRTSL